MNNTDKFTGKAEVYAKSRPGYPVELYDYLWNEHGMSAASIIADVGSGTGIFCKSLIEGGCTVYGVEPNRDMRIKAEELFAGNPRFISVAAPAEQTALEPGSIDFVTVAQAFHWFDREKFRNECQRILRPAGKVVLVWNSRIEDSPLVVRIAAITRQFCSNFAGFSGGIHDSNRGIGLFFSGTYDVFRYRNDLPQSRERFIERNLSASYAPKAEDHRYQQYAAALNQLFDEHATDNRLVLPNETIAYVGNV